MQEMQWEGDFANTWEGDFANTSLFAHFIKGQQELGVETTIAVTNRLTQEASSSPVHARSHAHACTVHACDYSVNNNGAHMQATVYSTCPPEAYFGAPAPLNVATEQDSAEHLIQDTNIMSNFLACQEAHGIHTSVCIYIYIMFIYMYFVSG